jgi:hypothetical protein
MAKDQRSRYRKRRSRQFTRFPEVKGKIVESIEVDPDVQAVVILFKDRTALSFDLDPALFRRFLAQAIADAAIPKGINQESMLHLFRIYKNNLFILKNYVPDKCEGKAILLKAQDSLIAPWIWAGKSLWNFWRYSLFLGTTIRSCVLRRLSILQHAWYAQQEGLGWMQFRAEGLTQCLTMFR